MKKLIFNSRVVMMMMFLLSMTVMTSCSKSDDDGGKEQTESNISYFVPCTAWGQNAAYVKQFMQNTPYSVSLESEGFITYKSKDGKSEVYYGLGVDEGLMLAQVYYASTSEKDLKYVVSQTEKVYNVSFEKILDDGETIVYLAMATIAGKIVPTEIFLTRTGYQPGITVYMQVPDTETGV